MLSKIRQYFELIKYCFFGGITTLLNLALLYVFVLPIPSRISLQWL